MYKIMLIDDEKNILKSLNRLLSKQDDWDIEIFSDPHEALKRAQTTPVDVFLSDFRMPSMDGVEFLIKTLAIQPESIRVILSGYSDLSAILNAINQAEIHRFITKPWNDYELIETLKQLITQRNMHVENRRLADQLRQQKEELDHERERIKAFMLKYPELARTDNEDQLIHQIDE